MEVTLNKGTFWCKAFGKNLGGTKAVFVCRNEKHVAVGAVSNGNVYEICSNLDVTDQSQRMRLMRMYIAQYQTLTEEEFDKLNIASTTASCTKEAEDCVWDVLLSFAELVPSDDE